MILTITDINGHPIDLALALHRIAAALDRRFPEHNTLGDRLGRLLEELGELADAILTVDRAMLETGAATEEQVRGLVKELEDVLRALFGVALHYNLTLRLPSAHAERDLLTTSSHAFVLFAELATAAGAVAQTAHHLAGMGVKAAKYGPPGDPHVLRDPLSLTAEYVVSLAVRFDLRDALRGSIQHHYRTYQIDGWVVAEDQADPGTTPDTPDEPEDAQRGGADG